MITCSQGDVSLCRSHRLGTAHIIKVEERLSNVCNGRRYRDGHRMGSIGEDWRLVQSLTEERLLRLAIANKRVATVKDRRELVVIRPLRAIQCNARAEERNCRGRAVRIGHGESAYKAGQHLLLMAAQRLASV